jgi:hypothetical protein
MHCEALFKKKIFSLPFWLETFKNIFLKHTNTILETRHIALIQARQPISSGN